MAQRMDLRLFQGGTDEQVRTGDVLSPLGKVELALRNAFSLQGRASRSEFWWFVLASWVVTILLNMTLFTSDLSDGLPGLIWLLLWVPSVTLGVRRLHDVGQSGWWLLVGLTGIGMLLLLFWNVQPGDAGPNRYNLPFRAGNLH